VLKNFLNSVPTNGTKIALEMKMMHHLNTMVIRCDTYFITQNSVFCRKIYRCVTCV